MQIGKSRMVRTESRHNAILPIRQIDTHRKGIVFRNKGTCSRRGGCGGATARTQREATRGERIVHRFYSRSEERIQRRGSRKGSRRNRRWM